ncbi:MAG: DUF357 domain-containing protein [Candidatus Thermoplasmatota archaeon]|nr:DUF357 domain-containing protein [Candidatus Thermoplasmatota archaeon]
MELEEKVVKYIELEEEALEKLKISAPEDSFLIEFARDAMKMIVSYFNDAKHFHAQNDEINAFAALNYSYGWIDSLVRLGIFDGDRDHRLFTLFK